MGALNREAMAYLAGTSVFYGLLIVVQKIGLNSGLEPLSFSFSRSVVILLLSLVFFFPELGKIRYQGRRQTASMVILGVLSAIAIVLLFYGQNSSTATSAGFLIRLTPLFVLPFSFLMLGERHSAGSAMAMGVMLAGTFLLTTGGTLRAPGYGEMMVIAVASLIALQNVFAKWLMNGASTEMVICFRVCISAMLIIAFVPLAGGCQCMEAMFEDPSIVVLSGVLYFLSVICQYRAIRLVGPFTTTSLFLTGSLFSALLAYAMLGETLLAAQWLGVAGILAGGYLLVRGLRGKDTSHETMHLSG
jgi:drug/metabolite transporter (DMT)-like permease